MFVSNASRAGMHCALPPVVVMPEGTAPASVSSATSVTSLIPLKRRIPQAPVFITRNAPPATSFISDASISSPPRTYYFDDDYPSIGASESTAPPEATRAQHASAHQPYPRRPSVTGAIRRRISLARRHDDRMLPHTLSQKFKRASMEHDSVIDDWNRSRKRSSTSASARAAHPAQPASCAPFVFRSLFTRHHRPQAAQATVPVVPVAQHKQRVAARAVVPELARQPHDEINLMSTLAYEDFMHGRNRPTKSLRVFARLRRA